VAWEVFAHLPVGGSTRVCTARLARRRLPLLLVLSPWLLAQSRSSGGKPTSDRRATRPEDWKRRGRARHYESVPVRCSRIQSPR
jgi:hypothetical protein